MRKPPILCLVLGPLLSLGGGQAGAQEVPVPPLEEVGARIEALRPELDEARGLSVAAEQALWDSVRAATQVPQDTVMVGPFRIVTLKEQAELAKEAFQPNVEELAPYIMGTENLFQDHTWTFFYGWWRKPIYVDEGIIHEVKLSRRYSAERLEQQVRRALGEALHNVLPDDGGKLGMIGSSMTYLPGEDWSWAYRELAAAPYLAARECLAGDLGWCWEALGVTSREGGGPEETSPEGRRRLVQSRYEHLLFRDPWIPRALRTRDLLVHGCLQLKQDQACQLLLEGYHYRPNQRGKDYPIPLGGEVRGTVVAQALRMGGEGSFTRLIANPEDPLEDRLAHAAGVPAEVLIAHWRDRVMRDRPNAQAGLLRSPLSLALWLVLLMAFALRSSRWRLG